jgi:hypothetical protein
MGETGSGSGGGLWERSRIGSCTLPICCCVGNSTGEVRMGDKGRAKFCGGV